MAELTTNLHIRIWGDGGPPVLLLHGSTAHDGAGVWGDQRVLAEQARLIVPDRRGYGASPGPASTDWEDHVADALALLGDGAHFVGHSYGGVIGLIVASRRPDLVWSLTVIEPPAFGVARGVPVVEDMLAKLIPIFEPPVPLEPAAFNLAFARVFGANPPANLQLTPHQEAQTRSIQREPAPWTAPIDLASIAGKVPTLVVDGDWNPGFSAVCATIAAKLNSPHAILPGHGHGPHHLDGGGPFNALLRDLWHLE